MNFNPKIINFFKKHNMYETDMFNYLQENSTMIDYTDEEQKNYVGCFYILDKNDILKKIQLNLPYVHDDKTALISIHELVHGIENYKKIGKKFKKDITIEALPLLYEKIYIMENSTEELLKYGAYLDEIIEKESKKEYKFGLKIREELLKKYNYNMKQMKKMSKKLSRKYLKRIG